MSVNWPLSELASGVWGILIFCLIRRSAPGESKLCGSKLMLQAEKFLPYFLNALSLVVSALSPCVLQRVDLNLSFNLSPRRNVEFSGGWDSPQLSWKGSLGTVSGSQSLLAQVASRLSESSEMWVLLWDKYMKVCTRPYMQLSTQEEDGGKRKRKKKRQKWRRRKEERREGWKR